MRTSKLSNWNPKQYSVEVPIAHIIIFHDIIRLIIRQRADNMNILHYYVSPPLAEMFKGEIDEF